MQLKGSLRGAAFVRGTLFLLRGEKLLTEEGLRRFLKETNAISAQITDLLRTIRESQV